MTYDEILESKIMPILEEPEKSAWEISKLFGMNDFDEEMQCKLFEKLKEIILETRGNASEL